jgi:Leucine-rich repeat (LRR) protein
MRQLHDLILRNNSIEELNRQSFASVPQLVGLDLSHNELKTLRAGTFGSLQRLRLLKLEHNQLETVEKGAFVGKVDTVLLDGEQKKIFFKMLEV